MHRMCGISWVHGCTGTIMYRMYGIPQGAREGGADMPMDGRYAAGAWMRRSGE